MTSNQNMTCDEALALAGFASIDDAREANVFFVCHACGSVKVCTPAPGQTREEQRDMLIADFEGMDECCEDGDNSIL
jgi:hypothetical protein